MIDSRLSFDFVHKGYEKALDEVDRSSNRIAVSLIISALIVGSALIVLAGKGPMVWDFPVLGIVGFVIAGVMGFVLAIQILRSGKY
jgi:ubiquinone biosynthesis protein